MNAPVISVVVPLFNEELMINEAIETIDGIVKNLKCTYELVFVNDGSSDNTEALLRQAEQSMDNIVGVHFSRNFGKEAAMVAGIEVARGDCVLFIDADLQHPPELIPQMFARWLDGVDVVNAKKKERGTESIAYKLSANLFNWGMSSALNSDFGGASDYKLIDRKVVDALMQCSERNRFFRGLVTWVGFRTEDVEFDVEDRTQGESKWNGISMLRYSANNLLAFTSFPLRLVAYLGFATVGVGGLLLLQTFYKYLTGAAADGFTTVIAVQILLGGMLLSSMGVIALYIAKIYQEQKARQCSL